MAGSARTAATALYNDYFGNAATGTFFKFFSHNGVLDDTFVLSPTLVLDVRYGYNRFIRGRTAIRRRTASI